MICYRKYIEKLYATGNILFNNKLPTNLHMSFAIIKLLIKNLNLIHNKSTYVYFNYSSRKRKLDKLYIWMNEPVHKWIYV